MPPDAVYVHPFESGGYTQQQQQQQQSATVADPPRPRTSLGLEPTEVDWRLLALASTKKKQQQQQQQQQSISAVNLAKDRSSSALNPLSNSRDIDVTLSAAAAAAGASSAAHLQDLTRQQRHNTPRAAAGWTAAELLNIKVLCVCDV
jgi:CHASE3 domain sensor protein